MKRPSRIDYCQFLLSSQTNYTLTYFADHTEQWSHDTIRRYLQGEKLSPRLIWEQVKGEIISSEEGYLVFDDTVLDKDYSESIELVRRQYSGNAHRVIKGIGVVSCLYVHPKLQKFWILDFRIYAPDEDGKTKLQHVQDMLTHVVYHKRLPFYAVLMDSWYTAKWLMLFIERIGKVYYGVLRENRLVNQADWHIDYQHVAALIWFSSCRQQGKLVHIKDFPKGHNVRLFRLLSSPGRTDYVVTNDLSQDSAMITQEVSDQRWKVEQFHREAKQNTGLEHCECRKARIQRNHITCALLVWVKLKIRAYHTQNTVYQLKQNLLSHYLIQELRSPQIKMSFA